MRRLVVRLAVVVVLLVVADRVAAAVAAGVVASRLQESGELRTQPSVSIEGFPFLTQAVDGRYDRVTVEIGPTTRGGVRLERFDATIVGARIPLRDAVVGGTPPPVPVQRLSARAVVRYVDLASAGGVDLALEPLDGGVAVTGRVTVLGQAVRASTVSDVRLDGATIVVTARSVKVLGASSPALDAALAGQLDLRVPVGRLPYGLDLTGVEVTSGGLVLTASSGPTVLTVPR